MNQALPIDSYRPYLLLLARTHLDSRYQRRVDASDIVQHTLMEAYEKRHQFAGTDSELGGWLRRILLNNVLDAARAQCRERRDIRRERSLESEVERSFNRAHDWLVAEQSTASQRAIREEQILIMSKAIDDLDADQREAVILKHLQGKSLRQLAEHLDRSESAAAGLLHRGLSKLRLMMERLDQQ